MNKQLMVTEFMLATGRQRVPSAPEIPDIESRKLRCELIREEFFEFLGASGCGITYDDFTGKTKVTESSTKPNITLVADALADLLYVVYGAAVAYGIKIDPVFGAVHRANMEKFGPGGYQREDGKWIKPPDWRSPDIAAVLAAQSQMD